MPHDEKFTRTLKNTVERVNTMITGRVCACVPVDLSLLLQHVRVRGECVHTHVYVGQMQAVCSIPSTSRGANKALIGSEWETS